jgi:GTP:adenosylcobinamide-phosphate guanylyltransferase
MAQVIIIAGGVSRRWHHDAGVPKHLVEVHGVTLLERIVRQVRRRTTDEVFLRVSDPSYQVEGATTVMDRHGNKAFDMFCYEMLDRPTLFLYGDTYYSDQAMDFVVAQETDSIAFLGSGDSIVAIRVEDVDGFKHCLELIKDSQAEDIRGWTLYQSINDLPPGDLTRQENYREVPGSVVNVNTAEDYSHLETLVGGEAAVDSGEGVDRAWVTP